MPNNGPSGTTQRQQELRKDSNESQDSGNKAPLVLKAGQEPAARVGSDSVRFGQDGCGY